MDNRFVVILRNMYSPLGPLLEIGKSKIHGHGLFAKTNIPPLTNLGESHFHVPEHGEVIRTPLGGFINHHDDPNCEKAKLYFKSDKGDFTKWNLITIKNIKEGEELTLSYTFYKL